MRRWVLSTVLSLLVLFTGCQPEKKELEARLMPLEGCKGAVLQMRLSAITAMEDRIEREYQFALDRRMFHDWWEMYGVPDAPTAQSGAGDDDDDSGAGEYSGTNNQVAGVDEADFIKNDGNHIWVVSGSKMRIIDAYPPPQAHVVSEVEIEGEPKKMFVYGDRALVYSALADDNGSSDGYNSWHNGECTYGYSCSFTGDGHPTKISIFDIEDLSEPELEEEIYLSGSFIAARRIEGNVHTVVTDPGARIQGVEYRPEIDLSDSTPSQIGAAYRTLRDRNRAVILAANPFDWLPSAKRRVLEKRTVDSPQGWSEEDLVDGCSRFLGSTAADGSAVTSVISLNMDEPDEAASFTSVVTKPGAVYASHESLYIAVPRGTDTWGTPPDERVGERSTIHKFALQDGTSSYVASGDIKGRVLNQFSMDEHESHLRVATSSERSPSPSSHSTVTVLAEDGEDLVATGLIDNIAPTEDIRSVRFDGKRGFVVTFKKTDPLFVLDLEDARNPSLLAELKIPGFSTYMHMMDENHILTVGYDGDDQGNFAWFTSVRLQIFDVSDLTDPKLSHVEIIGTRGSSSEALTNHLAFNYFAPRDLLALPMTVCEGSSGGGSYGDDMTFSGLMVWDVTADGGFSTRGEVEHPPTDPEVGCDNWWTQANSQVKRSVIMDDWVYSVAMDRIKVNALNDLGNDLVEIDISQ